MKKEKFWYVYAHTNKINGKKYIGITGQQRYWDRWRSDGSGYKTQVFGRAVEKYGWENFEHEILDKVTSELDACKLEQFYIRKYKTTQKDFGYNISFGGEATLSGLYNLSSISIPVYQYNLNGDFIAEFPSMMEAERQTGIDNSAICSCCKGVHKYTKEFIWSYEKHDKINGIDPKAYRYENSIKKQKKRVYKYNLQGEFIESYRSLSDASSKTNIDFRNISACCLGQRKRTGEYMWSYIYSNTIEPYSQKIKISSRRKKAVYQYDLCGKLIKIYTSASNVLDEFNISIKRLRDVCRKNSSGIFVSYSGYVWSYSELNHLFFCVQTEFDVLNSSYKIKKQTLSKYDNVTIFQYSKDGNFIRQYTNIKEVITFLNLELKAISSILACCKGNSKTSYGYQWRFDFKHKINAIPQTQTEKLILKLDRKGVLIREYDNVMQICKEYDSIPYTQVIKNVFDCVCGKLKTYNDFIWIFKENYSDFNIKSRQKTYKTIPVAQYDKNNNYIQTFNSIADAQKYINVGSSHISDCCKGKRKTSNGYIWKYVD